MFGLAFQSEVLVYDPYLSAQARTKWTESLPRVRFIEDLDDLLGEADIVSLHLPLTKGTTNLIAMDQLKRMKRSAILVNSARGGIVNEDDLAEALEQNLIFGAGLDAFANEPPSKEKYERFCKLDNVVLT